MKISKMRSVKMELFRLNFWQAILFLVFMSLALAGFLFFLQPVPIREIAVITVRNLGLNVFLNWVPLFWAMMLLYFAGTGAASASTIVGAAAIGLGFANRIKILLRNDPLVPWDLLLGGEVAGIARSFGSTTILAVIGGAILYVVLAVLFALVIRSGKVDLRIRGAGLVLCAVLPFVFNAPLYNNHSITNSLYIRGNVWNQVNQFNSRGFLFSFIHAFNTNRVMRPEGYNPALVLERIRNSDTSGEQRLANATLPHIIMVQSEAFSEISLLPYFDFTGFDDPLENWRELVTQGINGSIVVSVIGGGTAETEFDVLTGLNSRQFTGVPFAFRMITDEFESMATLLNRLGYRSEFMHPGYAWFYNRQNVYRHLGFSRMVFIDEFEGIPTKGMYINEHDTINRTMEMFAQHRENYPGVPYFHFAVTIQNHGPYPDKYLYDGPVTGPTFTTDLDLQEIDINALSNYFHGVQDGDRELARLVEYLDELAEPVVLIYYSDHLPAFHGRIYDTIFPDIHEPGSFESITRLFQVPFLIWMNAAALELYGISHPAELADPMEDLLFSAPFFGAYVMELLGFTNLSPFWDFNAELRRLFPVMTEMRSFTPNRTPSTDLTDDELAPLLLYRDWSYFRIFEERNHE